MLSNLVILGRRRWLKTLTEDDWLATAASKARARVEVNIRKFSHDER